MLCRFLPCVSFGKGRKSFCFKECSIHSLHPNDRKPKVPHTFTSSKIIMAYKLIYFIHSDVFANLELYEPTSEIITN